MIHLAMMFVGLLLANPAFGQQTALDMAHAHKVKVCENLTSDACTQARALVLQLKRIEAEAPVRAERPPAVPATVARPAPSPAPRITPARPAPVVAPTPVPQALAEARFAGPISHLGTYADWSGVAQPRVCYLFPSGEINSIPAGRRITVWNNFPLDSGLAGVISMNGRDIDVITIESARVLVGSRTENRLMEMRQVLTESRNGSREVSYLAPGQKCHMVRDWPVKTNEKVDVAFTLLSLTKGRLDQCGAQVVGGTMEYYCDVVAYRDMYAVNSRRQNLLEPTLYRFNNDDTWR